MARRVLRGRESVAKVQARKRVAGQIATGLSREPGHRAIPIECPARLGAWQRRRRRAVAHRPVEMARRNGVGSLLHVVRRFRVVHHSRRRTSASSEDKSCWRLDCWSRRAAPSNRQPSQSAAATRILTRSAPRRPMRHGKNPRRRRLSSNARLAQNRSFFALAAKLAGLQPVHRQPTRVHLQPGEAN